MKAFKILFIVLLSVFLSSESLALTQFSSEAAAQRHCPQDTVVWLNLPTMIWHSKGATSPLS